MANRHLFACVCMLVYDVQEARRTPLHWAAHNGHYDCVVMLLEKCAHIEATGSVSSSIYAL
jgi:ankyrin repeat protein